MCLEEREIFLDQKYFSLDSLSSFEPNFFLVNLQLIPKKVFYFLKEKGKNYSKTIEALVDRLNLVRLT